MSAAAAVPVDPNSTFTLHSKPGSPRTIFLDFNGGPISGTAWNDSYNGGNAFTAGKFDLDGNAATLSAAEHRTITEAWHHVAEDYAPFDVDVTTQTPDPAAIDRASSSDTVFGTRVVVTTQGNPLASACGCGGIAYVGAFDIAGPSHAFYQPAFVFMNNAYDGKSIAEAASHEVGHNGNLVHDGTGEAPYYGGHGSWAPIMGVGYNQPITQWSSGEYTDAVNREDDLAVMGANGLAQRPDDHGDTRSAATALSGPNVAAAGIITNRTDVDVFRFAAQGAVQLNVIGWALGSNLDIKAELVNAAGVVLASSDPGAATVSRNEASGLGAVISANVAAGTYYLVVDGVGYGSPLNTGYSDYASLGNYTVTGTITPTTTNQPPIAVASATPASGAAALPVSFSSAGSTDPDGTIASYSWAFGDNTTSTAENRQRPTPTAAAIRCSSR